MTFSDWLDNIRIHKFGIVLWSVTPERVTQVLWEELTMSALCAVIGAGAMESWDWFVLALSDWWSIRGVWACLVWFRRPALHLYTSGSTGKPKVDAPNNPILQLCDICFSYTSHIYLSLFLYHSTRVYCIQWVATCFTTAATFKMVFDYHSDDVYWCTADIGWITGHLIHHIWALGQWRDQCVGERDVLISSFVSELAFCPVQRHFL